MIEVIVAAVTSPGGVGVIGALLTLLITKFFEWRAQRRKEKQEEAKAKTDEGTTNRNFESELRDELRDELTTLREQLATARAAEDEWRQKYWAQSDDYAKVKRELAEALGSIKGEADAAVEKLG